MQPRVPEPILAVGSFTRAGGSIAGYAAFGSGIASMVLSHQAKKRSAGLPRNLVAALPPHSFYVWKYKGGYKLKIKGDPAMVLDRRTFHVTIGGNDGFAH